MQEKKGVLILEGHVQGLSLLRSIGEAGIPAYVIDTNNCLARYSKYCKKFFKCPDYKTVQFIDFLVQLAKDHKIQGWALFPSNDHIVNNISKNKSLLKNYYSIITPNANIISTIYNKRKLLQIAQNCSIPTPLTFYHDTIQEWKNCIRYPVLIKGIFGLTFYKTFHKKVIQVENQDALEQELNKVKETVGIENVMIQELIPYCKDENVISFTSFCIQGEIKAHWIGEKLREHPIKFGTATFSQSVINEVLFEKSVRLIRELNYTGVCEIEYLKDPTDEKYKLLEMNARTWLWVGLAKACGIDYAIMIYNYLYDIDMLYPDRYREGIKWINLLTDTVYSLQSITHRKISLRNYHSSFKGKIVFAVFDWKDIVPGLIFPCLGFYILIKRR